MHVKFLEGARVLTLTLPLPWSIESLWLLTQVSVQIFIIIVVLLLIYCAVYLLYLAATNDKRILVEAKIDEARRAREREEERKQENLEEWRQEIHSLLHKISERMDKK